MSESSSSKSSLVLRSATKRIHRDIFEWRECERQFPNISAEALEENIFHWHFNLVIPGGDDGDVALHGEIKFPKTYPSSPPKLSFSHDVPHKQVIKVAGGKSQLCMNMLEKKNRGFYCGWSSAFSITSVFSQMELWVTRLRVHRIDDVWRSFECVTCGHDGSHSDGFHPKKKKNEPLSLDENESELKEDAPVGHRVCHWSKLHADVEGVILSYLSQIELKHMLRVNSQIHRVLLSLKMFHHRMVECFHSHANFGEFYAVKRKRGTARERIEANVFGVGFSAEFWSNDGVEKLKDLHICPDVFSYGAYSGGVRYSMWRDMKFTDFLPLYLNNEHGRYSLPLAERIIREKFGKATGPFNPIWALKFISKLMNTTVVSLMNEIADQHSSDSVHLFTSTKALQSYIYLYHLLLGFAKKYQAMVRFATRKVNDFLDKSDLRNKANYPDLGEFLIYVSIVPIPWSRFGPILVEEALTRNAKWILMQYPSLIRTSANDEISCVRMRESWEATVIGKRLQMFQYYFLHNVCGVGNETEMFNLEDKLHVYNKTLGQVSERIAVGLQRRCRAIFRVGDWFEYFELINLPCPSSLDLCQLLRLSMVESDRKGYHRFVETPIAIGEKQAHEDADLCLCSGSIKSLRERESGWVGSESDLEEDEKEMEMEMGALDVAFSIDCFAGVASFIEQLKRDILTMSNALMEKGFDVRFAVVGYRDHGAYAHGDWPGVTKVFDFGDADMLKENLTTLTPGGGGRVEGVAESWCEIGNLNWRRNSIKVCLNVIGLSVIDLKSTNLVNNWPGGLDPVSEAQTLVSKKVTIYSVGKQRSYEERSRSFYQGTAHMTGGLYLKLDAVANLSQTVVQSALEEASLVRTVIPLVVERLPTYRRDYPMATRDQLAYFIWRELVALGVQTEKIDVVTPPVVTKESIAVSECGTVQECFNALQNVKNDAREIEQKSVKKKAAAASPSAASVGKKTRKRKRGARGKKKKKKTSGEVEVEEVVEEELRRQKKKKKKIRGVDPKRLISLEQTLRCLLRSERELDRLEWIRKGCMYDFQKYHSKEAENRFSSHGVRFEIDRHPIQCHRFGVGQAVEYHDYRSHLIFPARVVSIDRQQFSMSVSVAAFGDALRRLSLTSRNVTRMGVRLRGKAVCALPRDLSNESYKRAKAEMAKKKEQAARRAAFQGRSRKSQRRSQRQSFVSGPTVRAKLNFGMGHRVSIDTCGDKGWFGGSVSTEGKEKEKEMQVVEPASVVFENLFREDLVVKSALCVIPPDALWGPIQNIRREHDKGYVRWMPHINVLYPYVKATWFDVHADALHNAFRARKMKPFRVEFVGFDYFDRQPSSSDSDPELYVYLKTRVVSGDSRSWRLLMEVMKLVYPSCGGVNTSSFRPHLTVAQVARSRVKRFISELTRSFTRSAFDVDGVCLISRSGYTNPFQVDRVVEF